MKIFELLQLLHTHKIKLLVNKNKLQIDAPKGAMTTEILSLLKNNKQRLIDFILDTEDNIPDISTVGRNTDLQLSYAQKRLWFLDQMDGGSSHYNLPGVINIIGDFKVDVAQVAFSQIIKRHETLRTVFVGGNKEPLQVIHEKFTFIINETDFSELTVDAQDLSVKSAIKQDAELPFDLSKDLMLRVSYLHLSEKEGVMLFNMHHIASDGWSIGILVNEFITLYRSNLEGKPNPLTPLTIQYADYAQWQSNWLGGGVLEQQLRYWDKQLADLPQVHNLPLDFERPKFQSYNGATHHFKVDNEILKCLNNIALKEQATLFMLIHAAFSILLSRYSNSNDIVIGTPIANRQQKELEGLIGFFVNTMVLRADCSGNPSFIEFLTQIKNTNIDAQTNQDVPFEHLVDRLKPVRSTSHNALFQIMLSMNTNEEFELKLPNVNLSPHTNEEIIAKFDLVLNAVPIYNDEQHNKESGLHCYFEYNTDLFNPKTIEHLASSMQRLLIGIAADATQRIAQLPLLSDEESRYLLYTLNDTQAHYSSKLCIHQIFEQQVNSTPDKTAIIFAGQSLTYKDLNSQANQLAYYLIEQGVKPNQFIGLCIERSLEMLIGLMAILKAGAAYLPLDPCYPKARLEHMMTDSALSLVLTQHMFVATSAGQGREQLVIDNKEFINTLSNYPVSNPVINGLTANHLAYIIYTSGSTGLPKGVMVEHKSVSNLANNIENLAFNHNKEKSWGWIAPLVFDASLQGICMLIKGQTLHIISDDDKKDFNAINKLLRQKTIGVIDCTPTLLELWFSMDLESLLPDLIIGGEPISTALWQRIVSWQAGYGTKAINVYGPTECCVDSSSSAIHGVKPTIGKVMSNEQFYVLDNKQQLLPQGSIGELYIGGEGLARGYLNRPELSEQSFIANPFTTGRLYKTGDLVRYLDGGNLEFVGRVDQQVKIRGFRIELGEIEQQLVACADVESSLVVLHQQGEKEKRLVAYFISDSAMQEAELINDIRTSLQAHLPDYMIPSVFMRLAHFPLTANGKIDHKALPMPDVTESIGGYVPPEGEIEQSLVRIWAELLKIPADKISTHANFFDLGGHSLLSIRLIAEVRSVFDCELSVRQVFESPQLSHFAQQILASATAAIRPLITSLQDRGNQLTPSYAQQRLWFIDQMDGGSVHYNMPSAMHMYGDFKVDVAQAAFAQIIARHESLRTVFVDGSKGPSQVIHKEFDFSIRQTDLSTLTAKAQQQAIEAAIKGDANQIFDLSTDLMLRVAYLRINDDEGIMLFNMHHIASDGWSIGILVDEFVKLYHSNLEGKPDPLPPLSIQYADYAHWQRNWLSGDVLEEQLNYWDKQLADLPQVHHLPLDYERPEFQTFNGATHRFKVDNTVLTQLKGIAQENQVTLFMLMHAVFSILLSRYSNSSDIVIGTPVANRLQKELAGLIGFFVNTLVLRANCADNPSFVEFLEQIKNTNLDAQANQDVPFEHLVDRLKPARSTSHNALFQIMLSMDTNETFELELPNVSLSSLTNKKVAAKFDLSLYVGEAEDLELVFEYNTDLFTAQSIERLAIGLQCLLQGIAVDTTQAISQLPLLSNKESHYLLETLNDTQVDYPTDLCIHELFEQQVKKTPNNNAVVYKDQSLSYRELNKQANQLAAYLISQGAKADSFIGLCVERSLEMMVGLLAILKAGCAYLPLDPSYPKDRLEHMLDDSQVQLLLTQRRLLDELNFEKQKVICIDEATEFSHHSKENIKKESINLSSNNLAYIIYTSGSTGKPKGAAVEHRNETNLLYWYHQQYNLNSDDKVLILSAIGFDLTQKNLFAPLICGASVQFATPRFYDVNVICNFIQNNHITFTNCAPSVFYPLVEHQHNIDKLNSLRCVLFGGEAIAFDRLHNWLNQASDNLQLINMYGPTECTDISCAYQIPIKENNSSVPIGMANANVQLYVLNTQQQLTPFGVAGELCVGGLGVSRGYLNQPELTAEKFIQHPFSNDDRQKIYRTGDLVKWSKDAQDQPQLEFVGRIDNQIKIRGFRVELGEIESCLNKQDNIKQSVVTYDPDKQQLIAYLVAIDNRAPDIAELRLSLKKGLPDYMLPNGFILIEELPLTTHGKIDKKALSGSIITEQLTHYQKPQGKTEKVLVQIWSKLLNIPKTEISVDANFFELGGHSLLLTNMLHQIIEQLGVQLEVKDIFHAPNVCDIAHKAQMATAVHLLTKQDNSQPLPLSYGQYRIWFIEQLRDQTNEHNIAIAVKIKGIFNVEILQQALNAMIKQHDILRTKIIIDNNTPMQVVEPCYTYGIDCTDLSHLSASDRQHEISNLSHKHDTQVFDLTQLPLLSVLLLKIGQQEYLLHFNQHHIISDGWSQQLFYSELMSLYQQIDNKQEIKFKAGEFNYADYAVWQQQWLESETVKQQRVFWKDYLKNCNEQLSLPIQKSKGTLDGRQNLIEAMLDSSTRNKLKTIAHAHKGSLFNVLHSGFALLLCRLSGETDFNIGLPVTGRHIYGTQNMLGMFLNTLPIRHKLNLDTTFKDLLKQQIKNIEQVLSHQDLPLEQIFEVTQCDRNVESTPLFQILFNMLSVPENTVEDGNLDFQMHMQETSEIENKFNITLYLKDSEQGIKLFCHYNSSAFSQQHIRNLLDQYLLLLFQIATDINKPCQAYSLNRGGNKINYLRDLSPQINAEVKDVTALFRQQALNKPESIAIKDEFHLWSYQNLLNYSYGLASELKSAGVKRGDIVTIMASRQANLVAGILAVLQLGAAYSIVLDNMPINRLVQHLQIVDNSVTLFCEAKGLFNADLIEKIESLSSIKVMQNNPSHYPVLNEGFIPETNLLDLTASIIFTSGSSGIPKAVQGTHLGLSAYLNWLPEFVGFTNMDNFGMLSGLAHDPLQRDIFGALCNGATVCIPSKQQFASYQLADWMKQFEVSVLHLTPAMAEIIGMQAGINLDYVKIVFLTGEALRRDTVAKLLQLNSKLRIFNCYGATETQRAATYFEISDIQHVPAVIPISMSSKDTRLRLLTDNDIDCGMGEIGMICTESNRIAQGYLNDNTLTQQRFTQAEKGLRRYHTGDLGVCLDGKTIKYLGRKDSQINIRGFRVELGEIEYQLSQYPKVRSCTTIVHKDQYIIAYVTTDQGLADKSVFIEQCKLHLQQQLADYMLPSSIIVLDEIPLTENRKVDKKALPSVDDSLYGNKYHHPQGATEMSLVTIWSQLLKLPEEKISATANFFELGGHSLLLLKLITEIRQHLVIEVDLKYVFESKDLSSLATMLDSLIEQANISNILANAADDEIEEVEF